MYVSMSTEVLHFCIILSEQSEICPASKTHLLISHPAGDFELVSVMFVISRKPYSAVTPEPDTDVV